MPVKDTQRKNRHCLVTKLNNRVKNALFEVGDLEACQILGDLKKTFTGYFGSSFDTSVI